LEEDSAVLLKGIQDKKGKKEKSEEPKE